MYVPYDRVIRVVVEVAMNLEGHVLHGLTGVIYVFCFGFDRAANAHDHLSYELTLLLLNSSYMLSHDNQSTLAWVTNANLLSYRTCRIYIPGMYDTSSLNC